MRNTVREAFIESLQKPLGEARKVGEADIVLGIPFYNEVDTIGHVFTTLKEGIERFYPQNNCVIICAGDWVGDEALKVIDEIPVPENIKKIAFLLDKRVSGRGWALRAIMELTSVLGADLAIFEADLISREGKDGIEGLSSEWVYLLLEPIKVKGMDFVIPEFNRHPFDATVTNFFAYPLISSVYAFRVHEPTKGEFGLSNRFVVSCLKEARKSDFTKSGGYGADILITTAAITGNFRICEANLGVKVHRGSPGKREVLFRETAETLFEKITRDRGFWEGTGNFTRLPAVFGLAKDQRPEKVALNQRALLERYKQGVNKFCHTIYERVLSESISKQLEALAERRSEDFDFPQNLWVEVVYDSLLAFAFGKDFAKGDLLNALTPLYEGRLAGFAKELTGLEKELKGLDLDLIEALLVLKAKNLIEEQAEEFTKRKAAFLLKWDKRELPSRPILPKVAYWEFIPGVPLLLPQEIKGTTGGIVKAEDIHRDMLRRYSRQFQEFIHKGLKVKRRATSVAIAQAIESFMGETEYWLDGTLLPGNLATVEGTNKVVEGIFLHFPHREAFTLKPDIALQLVKRHPPANLIIQLGYKGISEILESFAPNDILALASWSEESEYMERIHEWLRENATPDHFAYSSIKPLVVNHSDFPSLIGMKESSALSKLTGRVIVANLPKGRGGDFPKIRYLTTIAKNIVEAERFGEVWRRFAQRRRDFGERVVNSIEGHWGREPFSAHNIFENGHQRELVKRLKEMVQTLRLRSEQELDYLMLSQRLEILAESYHLALTLPDGKFIPCSAWTWASYSFKGGKGVPTPLSLHVERDWASREFLVEYFKAGGGSAEEIDNNIVELMGEGREAEDLSLILLGAREREILLPQLMTEAQPKTGKLKRFEGNPILEPMKEHPWESRYVFNPGAIKLNGRTYIIYRAVGADGISRLGLAISSDGFQIKERFSHPIFEPKTEEETMGCEDPRLTKIGDRIYMLYTAYSEIAAQINLASISVADFLNFRFEEWKREGPAFPGFPDKDAFLFPEPFDGKYLMYHRISPSIWLSFSHQVETPWSREGHKILMGPRSGLIWDGAKIGGGAPPIKTKYGWLLVYHGIDLHHIYRLGVALVDLNEPSKLLYRSPNAILEPEEIYEVGEERKSWVPNVVFTCGAVPRLNKEILDEDDEILVYYGAADTVIGVAHARISELIPEEVRDGSIY